MRTLILLGHPDKKSLCSSIADNYEKGALEKGGDVKRLNLHDLSFNLNLKNGYRTIQNLEEDLVNAQNLIKWASHIVIIFPVWWGGVPALLKGFLDRPFYRDLLSNIENTLLRGTNYYLVEVRGSLSQVMPLFFGFI